MKGDFSRRTFDARKHYSAVLVEQGRLLTDADSDEQHRIGAHRARRATEDVIGGCGGPIPGAGFGLGTPDSSQLLIGAGTYYAGGTLLENESEVGYTAQPDRFDLAWPLPKGRYAVVLESWPRLVTALDDPSIREVALGGPTTSSRERVVWQVDAVPVANSWGCADGAPESEETTGGLAARAEPDEELSSPCLVPPQAGYTGLENQLYRVEIFRSGTAYDLDAGADTVVVTGFLPGEPHRVTVDVLGPLAVGDAVEVFRSGQGADPVEATFAFVTGIDGSTLTLSTALPAFGPTDAPAVRRVDAAFVVSRDNGSVVTAIESIDGAEVTVHDLGPDDVLGFAVGQLVEVTDDRVELEGSPRQLSQIAAIDQARRTVTLRTVVQPLDVGASGVSAGRHPKLRRWDAAGAVRFLADGTGWIHLENGNQVRFVDGHYRSGDYWHFPARAATVDAASGTIEWPQAGGGPALLPPFGIPRHRCLLGHIEVDGQGAITDLEDCRELFPPLTAMRNLQYVGGDGQEGSPAAAVAGFVPLPGDLAVRVANGGFPVAGAVVRFDVAQGGGRVGGAAGQLDVVTDSDGLATCSWELDDSAGHQVCVAQLLAPSSAPISHQLVRFDAILDRGGEAARGCCLSIGPDGDFPTLDAALADQLQRGDSEICLCLMPGDHEFVGGDLDVEPERRLHLTIRGCGWASRLRVRRPWQLRGFLTVRFLELDLSMTGEGFLSITDIDSVELRGMRITGAPSRVALVRVYGSGRLHVLGCVILSLVGHVFEGPRRFFDGADVLTIPWEELEEDSRRDATLKAAVELAAMTAGDRRALVKRLRLRLGDAGVASRGEVKAFGRLLDVIERDGRVAPLVSELELVARAAAVARPGVALEIGTNEEEKVETPARGSVVLADNIVPGTISFYGPSDPEAVVPRDVLKRLDALLGDNDNARIEALGGDVHVRDNRLGHLAVGESMVRLLVDLMQNPRVILSFYESFHLTDNVIDGVVSTILAGHSAMTSNDFTLDALVRDEPPPDGLVAVVVADTAAYTGNRARMPATGAGPGMVLDVSRASAEAANVEVTFS